MTRWNQPGFPGWTDLLGNAWGRSWSGGRPLFNPPREEEQQSTQGQPTEWQRIRNQIDAAMIFAEADFINVLELVIGQRLVESSG